MPKAPATRKAKTARVAPENPKSKSKEDPKTSHLYTDDNLSTTIHGTGFKDEETAKHTLELISRRSPIYQFQTVNTMYNRAKHHPSMKKAAADSDSTAGIRAAMEVFREWLDVTYPVERDALRAGGFKPLLSKKKVESYLERIEASKKVSKEAKQFAKTYCSLGKGKKLGNVLVDETKPEEPDWERKRYEALDELVPKGKETEKEWKLSELWTDDKEVADRHLELVAWAWSPVAESKLP